MPNKINSNLVFFTIMIGKLKGLIDLIYKDHVIIDVNGVGYLVYCSGKTIRNLHKKEQVEFLIETHVREDHIHLYGFSSMDEKSAFTVLQSVKGVGTRMALTILSHLTIQEIQMALSCEDNIAFNNISGIGKKLAERIITELKDKFITGNLSDISNSSLSSNSLLASKPLTVDAVSALVNLGITKPDAQNRVNTILTSQPDMPLNELIRVALNDGANK